GREMVHREFGYRQLEHVTELLSEIANVENPPRMEGRFLSMILVPNREAIAELARREKASGDGAGAEPAKATKAEVAAGAKSKRAAESGEAAEAENNH
ncbi:MAG: translation initiation factor IF-3 C-terminal domain-containing protein, partial [Deltaproteobacteria bacterium]|nr:translation initiation factor IF-3 C-terminal domain-containing protein [Deltaproteobacteria bacterium]